MTPRVQVHFEVFEFSFEVSIALLLIRIAHESRIDRKVYLQIELQLLRQQILLAKHDRNVTVPKDKEALAVALVEGVPHLLD